MEGENKVEETKVEETKVEKGEEVKAEDKTTAPEGGKKKCCGKGMCKLSCKNKGIAFGVILLLILLAVSYGYKQYRQKVDIGPDAIKAKTAEFLKGKIPDGVTLSAPTKENGVYKIMLKADAKLGGQEQPVYVSADGKKIFQGAIDLSLKTTDSASNGPAVAEKTEAESKTDVPTVDLFVMSYCPYGLQMEKGLLPAVEALGNKIKFNLKFVDYTLHGPKEVAENVNQYCIEKTQPTKLDSYLKCFWKSSIGTSAACQKAVGINSAQITSCVADTNKQFSPTEKAMGLNKDENVKFGVQGSPALVVNGTTIASGRDSASVLKAVCSGFTTQPKECQAKLPATSPSAGFDDQAAASASGSAAPASCATPAQ